MMRIELQIFQQCIKINTNDAYLSMKLQLKRLRQIIVFQKYFIYQLTYIYHHFSLLNLKFVPNRSLYFSSFLYLDPIAKNKSNRLLLLLAFRSSAYNFICSNKYPTSICENLPTCSLYRSLESLVSLFLVKINYMSLHSLRHITTKVHLLPSLRKLDNQAQRHPQAYTIYARGKLAGQFLFGNILSSDNDVLFTGDFKGYFKDYQGQAQQDCQKLVYFEGCIQNLIIESINGSDKNELIEELTENTFHGYFKGTIQLKSRWINIQPKFYTVKDLIRDQLIKQKEKIQVLIPVFTSFGVKSLNSVNFNTASAKVQGTLIIEIKLSQNIMRRLQNKKGQKSQRGQKGQHCILMGIGRQKPINLPLGRLGQKNTQGCFTKFKFNQQTKVMKYTIRKIFETGIDNTHGQFFAPFNLIYLKMVLSFNEIGLDLIYPEKGGQKGSINSGKKLSLKFLCYDLDDTLQPNNPFSNYNDLQKLDGHQKLKNKVTKIHTLKKVQCGDHLIASNKLALFPFYRDTIVNKTKQNTNYQWNFGVSDRHVYIVKPQVQSICKQFEKRAFKSSNEGSNVQKAKTFELKHWNHIHVQIPIYRYWFIYFIQICLPLLILSTISMFVFLQENGRKSDGFSSFNQRIANGIALLLAYAAMIPVLKKHMAQSTFFSFFHLVIYLSIIPMVLALFKSILDSKLSIQQWKDNYHPFEDIYFKFALGYVCFLVLVVIIIVIVAIKISLFDRQTRVNFTSIQFKGFKDASEPRCFQEYVNSIKEKRQGQFCIYKVKDIDDCGNGVGISNEKTQQV